MPAQIAPRARIESVSIINIVLLILLLASFVIAYFSARTWHWGHVLVVLGIFLSTLGFFVLSAETLRINAVLRKQVIEKRSQLADVEARNTALEKGSNDSNLVGQMRNEEVPVLVIDYEAATLDSLAELDHKLLLETRRRGRVWWNVTPTGFNQQSGEVTINVPRPVPAGVAAQSVVVLFEAGPHQLPAPNGAPRGAQYLGQFRVIRADAQTATLEPILPLDNFERQRLAASRGPWIMYDTMPADRHQVFADMTDEQLKESLPPPSVGEYLRHGGAASPDDDATRVVGFDADGKRLPPDQVAQAARKVYDRRLRDYALEFDELSRRRLDLVVDTAAAKQDLERLNAAQASAKELQAYREGEIQKLNNDLAGVTKERQAIEQHLAQVQQYVANGRRRLEDLLRRNSELARELASR
jgi:hypothetical protein